MNDPLFPVDFDVDLMHVRLIERFTECVFRIRRPMTGHTETRC